MKNQILTLLKICLSVLRFCGCIGLCPRQDENALTMHEQITVMGQTQAHSGFAGRFHRRGRGCFEIRSLCPGLQLRRAGRRAISHQRQQRRQRAGPRDGHRSAKSTLLARSYTGASLRRQAHAFANDIVLAITGKKGIGQTKIAFKAQQPMATAKFMSPISTATIAQAVTHDDAIVAAPAWVPGRLALYYTSYKPGNPDIFYHNLSHRPAPGHRAVIPA